LPAQDRLQEVLLIGHTLGVPNVQGMQISR